MDHPIANRLLWAVEKRAGGNQRELSRKAGLSESYLGTLLTRLRKKADAQIEVASMLAIAQAANVSISWLLTGYGTPDGGSEAEDGSPLRALPDYQPALDAAIAKAPYLPPWLWGRVGNLRNAYAPQPLTADFLVRTALYLYETVDLEEKNRLALEAQRAEIARHNAEFDEAEKKDPQQKLP